MSFSKSIRKKRRHSRKRNMKGGFLDSIASLSYNLSFVYSFHKLFTFGASENTSLYLRLEILYTQALEQRIISESMTLQQFVNKYFGIFFPMSCKIIGKFFEEYGTFGYCAAALQEMNLTKYYHDIMLTNTDGLLILANGVIFNKTAPGIGYVIQNKELGNYMNKNTEARKTEINSFASIYYFGETVSDEVKLYDVYSNFNVIKVAIQDLGTRPEYAEALFFGEVPQERPDILNGLFVRIVKDEKDKNIGLPDGGRPMALIVKQEGEKYIFHFNCHVPNPSALKKYPFEKSILENYLGQTVPDALPKSIATRDMDQWVEITLTAINDCGKLLLEEFFDDIELKEIFSKPDNYTILFSGDFNDGTGKLLRSINTNGLNFGHGKMEVSFPAAPNGCCANLNSVQMSPWGTASPPAMVLTNIDPTKNANPTLQGLLMRENKLKNSYIVNPDNFAFPGDITGSTTRLTADVYKPIIEHDIVIEDTKLDIDYNGLVEKFLHPSDHMPVVSATGPKRNIGTEESLEPKRQRSRKEPEDPKLLPAELSGGYRKKRRSQRKLKQRKSKRHTKKRNYRKNKK